MGIGFDQYFSTPTERGYLAESVPGSLSAGSAVLPTQGRQEMIRLKVPQAGMCTNIVINVATIGSSMTAGQNFAALYTGLGVLVAQSVDQTTNWGTTGNRNAQLNGGPYFLHAGEYYATFWWNGGTSPTLRFGASTDAATANGLTAAPNFLYCFNSAGLTTTAPATLGTQSSSGRSYWVALS